jgi:hypothetical protein
MPVVVNNGSSIKILYPREYYDPWADPKVLVRMAYQSMMWYIVRILYTRESYDSWTNLECPIGTVCQSTTNVVVDVAASFCCHMLMMMF